jgi:AraC-like DNA-binding protein
MQDVESLNFNIRSIYKQQAGAYLIGHDHGIIRFNPENKHLSKDDSRIIISKLSYQKEDRLIRKHNPSICNARYKLPFKAEDIEFNFNSPGLPAASSLYWQYRLTPEDSIWQIAPIHRKSAYYEKIKPADSLTFTIRLVDFSGEIYASESINLDVKKETKIHLPLILFLLITLILTGIILIRKKIRTKRNSLHSGSQMNGKQYAIPEHLDSFILSHLDDQNLSSANIEKHFGISRTKLFRVLKEKTGKSVTAYIRDVRLEEAEKLLNSKKFSVSEVIYKVGFNSRSYFYKCYKEKFGKNPKRPS